MLHNLYLKKVQLGVVDKYNVGRLNTSHLTTMAGDLLQKLICYYCAFFKNECSSDSDTSFDKFSLKTVKISQNVKTKLFAKFLPSQVACFQI